jgi:hypothetical protein
VRCSAMLTVASYMARAEATGRIHTPQPRRWVAPRGAGRMASGLVR